MGRVEHVGRKGAWVGVVILLLGTMLAGCSSPAQVNVAATVNGQTITMDQYLKATRLLYAVDGLQNSLPTWQTPTGRADLVNAQAQALTILMTNILWKQQLLSLIAQKKLTVPLATLDSQITSQTQSDFVQLKVQYAPLVQQNILTPESYRYLVIQRIYGNTFLTTQSVPIARVQIISVPTKAMALDLEKQVQAGADWTTLATKQSTDPAHAQGGDIGALPPGILPSAIDKVIFAPQTPKPDAIAVVQTPEFGWTLVRVESISSQTLSTLDNTVPVIQGSLTVLSAAINYVTYSLLDAAHISIHVDWCGNTSGQACGVPHINISG